MGILDKAKQLKDAERKAARNKADAEKRARERKDTLLRRVTDLAVASLRSLDGKKGFKVVVDETLPLIHGRAAAATLYQRKERVGGLCVRWESYKFRGSDESPEEDMEHIVIEFMPYHFIRDRDPAIQATTGYNSEDAIREAIKEFEQRMAEYLKNRI